MPFLTPFLTRFLTRIVGLLNPCLAKPDTRARKLLNLIRTQTAPADVHCLRKLHTLPVHDQTTDPIDHNTLVTRAPDKGAVLNQVAVRAGVGTPRSLPLVCRRHPRNGFPTPRT